jgi:hypothetical protein
VDPLKYAQLIFRKGATILQLEEGGFSTNYAGTIREPRAKKKMNLNPNFPTSMKINSKWTRDSYLKWKNKASWDYRCRVPVVPAILETGVAGSLESRSSGSAWAT